MAYTTPATGPEQPTRRVENYQPDEVERYLIGRATKRIRPGARRSTRYMMERQWYESVLFDLGVQWLTYNSQTQRFTKVDAPRWFPQPQDNRIRPARERLTAQFLKRKAVPRVRPDKNDAPNRQAAKDGEDLLAHIDDQVNEDALRDKAADCVVLTGTVLSKEWFNPNAGPRIEVPLETVQHVPQMEDLSQCLQCGNEGPAEQAETPCPECAQNGSMPAILQGVRRPMTTPDGGIAFTTQRVPLKDAQGQPLVQRFHLGEIQSEIVLPFDFYLDDNADSLDDAEWCGQASYRDLEWIDRNFPEKAKFVGEETGAEVSSFYRAALLHVIGQGARYNQYGGELLTGGAVVIEYEERASAWFPEGLLVIVANGVLLYAGPLRIQGDQTGSAPEFSYSDFRYTLIPGRFWGDTPIIQCLSHQRRINGLLAQFQINQKTLLNPWILLPDGSGVEPANVRMRPGFVLSYSVIGSGGTPPKIVPGTPLPAQAMELLNHAVEAINIICQNPEVTTGQSPPNIKAGIALSVLGENAEVVHMPRMRRWEAFIAARGRKRLMLAQQHYREQRLTKILGPDAQWRVRALQGADLRGNTDVTVEAGSALPRSRAAQIQLILDFMEAGLLGDVHNDPTLRQKILDEVGLTQIQSDLAPDRRRALMEHYQMDQGMTPPVGPYENKLVHLQEHLSEIRDPRFDYKSEAAKRAFFQHVKATRMEWIREQVAAQPPQEAAPTLKGMGQKKPPAQAGGEPAEGRPGAAQAA